MHTTYERIIMGAYYKKPVRVSDYMKGQRFVGYKAGSRINELCKKGIMMRVGSDGRFALYSLTMEGQSIARELLTGNHYQHKNKKLERPNNLFQSILGRGKRKLGLS